MDEHTHNGMTEFLKKELRAWEEARAERCYIVRTRISSLPSCKIKRMLLLTHFFK